MEGKAVFDYEGKKVQLNMRRGECSEPEQKKMLLKGLFPNINFSEKFCYKSSPGSVSSSIHNVTLFYVVSLFAAKSYHQLP